MSDYMFMLESHLSQSQNFVISEVQRMMAKLQVNVFLTGGALRDMLVGLPVRDLNFTLEGSPFRLVKALEKEAGIRVVNSDDRVGCFSTPPMGFLTSRCGSLELLPAIP
ncbi:MAG: hypothetical protein NTW74_24975 [Acidobacteria bacterium]|nr:hypothetical protein [Acidobacteriota bacterium]